MIPLSINAYRGFSPLSLASHLNGKEPVDSRAVGRLPDQPPIGGHILSEGGTSRPGTYSGTPAKIGPASKSMFLGIGRGNGKKNFQTSVLEGPLSRPGIFRPDHTKYMGALFAINACGKGLTFRFSSIPGLRLQERLSGVTPWRAPPLGRELGITCQPTDTIGRPSRSG